MDILILGYATTRLSRRIFNSWWSHLKNYRNILERLTYGKLSYDSDALSLSDNCLIDRVSIIGRACFNCIIIAQSHITKVVRGFID